MSTHNSDFIEKINAGEVVHADVLGGRVRLWRGTVGFAETTVKSGDVVNMLKLPAKGQLIAVRLGANVSLGTTTVKVGTQDDDDALRANAAKTDCKPEELMLPFTQCGGQIITLTAGTANAPAEGAVWIDCLVADV